MARRTFEMIDVIEILQHWHAGRPKTVVAASLGVDPKTVRKYVAPAETAGLAPGTAPSPPPTAHPSAADLSHIAAHRRLTHLRAVLIDQALPHPPRRVPLLAENGSVRLEPAIVVGFHRSNDGAGRSGLLRPGGTAEASAKRTSRRWTWNRRARSRTDSCSRS